MRNIEISQRKESLIMDESSQHKKQKLNDHDSHSKSIEIASKLIESGDSAQLREMLANKELSEINMDNSSGKKLLVAASEAGQLGCLRVLLDHLELLSTKLVNEQSSSDYKSCGSAYMTRGKHRLIKVDTPVVNRNGDVHTESLLLVACRRRYHHFSERYYTDYEIAEIEPDAIMSKYIYVDISNLLIEACKKSDIEQVEYLISMGADVNRVDYHGRNASVVACVAGDVKLTEVLLKHGANVNTLLQPIEYYRRYDEDPEEDHSRNPYSGEDVWWYFRFEFRYGDDPDEGSSLLHLACPDYPPVMKLLLEHGADVNVLDVRVFNFERNTPFQRVYELNTTSDESKTLLKQQAIDILLEYIFIQPSTDAGTRNLRDVERSRRYPLHLACAFTDFPMIERMLQHGADVSVIDEYGDTALLILLRSALDRNSMARPIDSNALVQSVELLLDYGADWESENDVGDTVLEYVEEVSELAALLSVRAADRKPLMK